MFRLSTMSDSIIILLVVSSSLCALLLRKWLQRTEPNENLIVPYQSSSWRALDRWRNLFHSKDILHEIYQLQIRDNQPRALRGIFSDCVIVPPSMTKWLLLQSEDDLSAKWAQMDALNIPMTFLKADIGINPVHEPLVRRNLTANLDRLAGVLHDEVSVALESLCGKDATSWRQINLDHTIRRIVARAANRILVGDRLCRDSHYIESSISYVTWVSTCGLLISLLPPWLKSTLGVVFTAPIRLAYSRCLKHLLPVLEDLLAGKDLESSHIFSSWLVDNLKQLPSNSPEHSPDYLSRRLMALNFAIIHTSTLTTASLILDIFSAQQSTDSSLAAAEAVIGVLRDEALTNRERWGGDTIWSRARLNQMVRLDSALRESMRRWGVVPKAFNRKVMRPEGVFLPNGQHLPCGTIVCISGWGLHHDEATYTNPFDFVYDRFISGSQITGDRAKTTVTEPAVKTSLQFAAWGDGKHACPGRFFAVDLIKVIMTRIILDYEVKTEESRPENIWIEYHTTPPPMATISVRWREAAT